MTGGSIAFDRAAEFYDETRRLPEDVLREVVRIVGAELDGRGRCLEVGIGTGRIALPLAAAGLDVAGIDLSRPMLRKLVEKAGGRAPVAEADAVALPFADATFGGAFACHVLHLIPAWQQTLAEMVRVVLPGGVVLVDMGGPPSGLIGRLEERIVAEAGLERMHVGTTDPDEVDDAVRELGGRVRMLEPISLTSRIVPEQWFRRIEQNLFAWTWRMTDEVRVRACEAARLWAESSLGALDHPVEVVRTIVWRAYDL